MKLIVKLPKDKPPFIGVVLKITDSDMLNQDLILEHKYADYRIELEFILGHVNLKLISNSIPTVRIYSRLSYDKDKLKAWFYITKGVKQFNYGHVRDFNGKDEIIKIRSKNFVLKMDSYKVFSENTDEFDINAEIRIPYTSSNRRIG